MIKILPGDPRGPARALLQAPHALMESGTTLHAAHTLYRRHGFVECGPLGDYGSAPPSVFMEKAL